MNKTSVYYDAMILCLTFEGVTHNFDLKEGDAGEFWHGFEHNGLQYDLNFFINDDNIVGASVYLCKKDSEGLLTTDTSNEIYIDSEVIVEYGDREKYMTYWWHSELQKKVIEKSGGIVLTITKERFLDWYFDEGQDTEKNNLRVQLANSIIHQMATTGSGSMSVQELFDNCNKDSIRMYFTEEYSMQTEEYDIEVSDFNSNYLISLI